MENLSKVISTKSLTDLEKAKSSVGSNLIEPTEAEISAIITLIKEGKSDKEIRKTWVRSGTSLTLSNGQIKSIRKAVHQRIAELKQLAEEGK